MNYSEHFTENNTAQSELIPGRAQVPNSAVITWIGFGRLSESHNTSSNLSLPRHPRPGTLFS